MIYVVEFEKVKITVSGIKSFKNDELKESLDYYNKSKGDNRLVKLYKTKFRRKLVSDETIHKDALSNFISFHQMKYRYILINSDLVLNF